MGCRFVHTADVPLNSRLATLALCDPELADLLGGATRKAFVAVIE
jgi:exonuclease SbcD